MVAALSLDASQQASFHFSKEHLDAIRARKEEADDAPEDVAELEPRNGEVFSEADLVVYREQLASATARMDQLAEAFKRYGCEGTRQRLGYEMERVAHFSLLIREQEELQRRHRAYLARRQEVMALRSAQMRMVAA